MSVELEFELCPETGIGCMLIRKDAEMIKVDLMPDEADDLKQLVQSGDLNGAKALLTSIDKRSDAALDGVGLEALAEELL